ncbi:MAG TPA: hypothetical protein VIW69_05770 [Candidatus Elarobacter sp.]
MKRIVLVLALLLGAPAFAAGAPGEYAMTVYANDELPWGHVFFMLSGGTTETVRGFYPHKRGPGALAGYNGGDVRDDTPTRWTARKRYPLDAAAYRAALSAVGAQYATKPDWSVRYHCGDYTTAIAHAAGVRFSPPCRTTGSTRPGLMHDYLIAQGGEANPAFGLEASAAYATAKTTSHHVREAGRERERLAARRALLTTELDGIVAAYHREYDPPAGIYATRCNGEVPEAELPARKAECESRYAAMHAVAERYRRLQRPVETTRAGIDAELAQLDGRIASEGEQLTSAIATLAELHVASADCTRKERLDAADCAIAQRGTVK